MNLKKAILHIYDINNDNFLYSQAEINPEDVSFQTYIEKMNTKLEAADCKAGILEDAKWQQVLSEIETNFVKVTIDLAENLFGIMKDNAAIPKGDLLFYLYEDDDTLKLRLGIIKLNFSNKFTHNVEYVDELLVNKLIVNQNILPSYNQRVEEGALIDVQAKECLLLEKPYVLEEDGKCFYFSEKFLKIAPKKNVVENIRQIKKIVEHVSDRYAEDKTEKKAATQAAVVESLEMFGKIDNSYIAEQVFQENTSAKEEYTEALSSNAIDETIEVRNAAKYEKKYRKQKFKLDNGIELSIPMDVYKNRDMIEFINNPDGTISVIIKNVDGMDSRFS